MSAVRSTHEVEELRRLIPLNTLPAFRFESLCSELKTETATKGSTLFRQGDKTTEFVYLLSGTVSLQAGGVEMDSVTGGSDVARFALAHQNPRKVSAVAKTQVRYVRVNPEDVSPREDSPVVASSYEVSDAEETSDGDWMSALLRSPVFQRLPPANLQAVLRSIEEIEVNAGQVICRQDDPGDYFYIIKSGKCTLTRKPTPAAKEIKLATLKSCDTFGEDALISEKPRTLTVTMDTDGRLLRLDKANFLKLVRDPVISRLNPKEAIEIVRQGGIWLDVRLPDLYQQSRPRGNSINAPFFSLRMMLPTLDRHKKYVCVCEDGKLSDAAAYLLLRHRYTVYVLKGGLPSLPKDDVIGEAPSAASAGTVQLKKPQTETREPAAVPFELEMTPGSDFSELEFSGPAEQLDATGHGAYGETDRRELQTWLNQSLAEKEQAEDELRQARQALQHLEAALQTLQREHETLLRERAAPAEAAEGLGNESLRQELETLKTRSSELVLEKESAEQKAADLEKQVDDLKAMVQEFLDQGELPGNEEAEALRTELKMVREHAGSELNTLQALLSQAESEKNRLRAELQSIKTKISVREIADSVEPQRDAVENRALASRILLPLVIGLLLTTLILGALFGLAPGRDFMRSLLNDAPQSREGSG